MDAQWLKTQFTLRPDKKQTDLARALGLSPPAISKILTAKRQIKAKEYIIMREFFDLPNDGAKAARAVAGSSYTLETLEDHRMLEETHKTIDEAQWIIPASVFESRTQAPPDHIKIFKVQENVMNPDFFVGEQVLVDLSDQKPSPPGTFLLSDGIGYIMRRCEHVAHSNPPEIKISARDSNVESYITGLDKVSIIGRVIAKLQWL